MKSKRMIFCLIFHIMFVCLFTSCIDQKVPFSSNHDLFVWLGDYEFFEFASPDFLMKYDINIYEENSEYYANINIDGHMRLERINAMVSGDHESIDIIFEVYLPDNINELFVKDDVLLRLSIENEEVYTCWEKLKPMLSENEGPNKVCFKKIDDDNEDEVTTHVTISSLPKLISLVREW